MNSTIEPTFEKFLQTPKHLGASHSRPMGRAVEACRGTRQGTRQGTRKLVPATSVGEAASAGADTGEGGVG